jgi:hypothetical protein
VTEDYPFTYIPKRESSLSPGFKMEFLHIYKRQIENDVEIVTDVVG